ncbi:hypothetical protein ACS0TY_025102 [Phlomoides rotata]
MASLPNKLITQVAFKAGGDIFHDIIANRPHHLAEATPTTVQGCLLHQGNFGTNGSVIQWNYSVDGKPQTAKVVLQDIDLEKKQIAFKVFEGDLCELYKNMITTCHVETKNGIDFITWTIDYELITSDNPHPLSYLNFLIQFTKELESHFG